MATFERERIFTHNLGTAVSGLMEKISIFFAEY